MLEVQIQTQGLSQVTKTVMDLPGLFQRARKSALSSTGWMVMGELRNHIEYGGSGWPPLHPITLLLRKYKAAGPTPLFYLGRFARYWMKPDGSSLEIGLGKTKSAIGRAADPWLVMAAFRAEQGEVETGRNADPAAWQERWAAATKRRRRGGDYFSLKGATRSITVPPRPIFGPVTNKIRTSVTGYFEGKFWAAYQRYASGAKMT